MPELDRTTLNTAISDRLADELFFSNSAKRNQKKANDLLDKLDSDNLKMSELLKHSMLTKTNKEIVLGKQPDTAIQINNSSSGSAIDALHRLRVEQNE